MVARRNGCGLVITSFRVNMFCDLAPMVDDIRSGVPTGNRPIGVKPFFFLVSDHDDYSFFFLIGV